MPCSSLDCGGSARVMPTCSTLRLRRREAWLLWGAKFGACGACNWRLAKPRMPAASRLRLQLGNPDGLRCWLPPPHATRSDVL